MPTDIPKPLEMTSLSQQALRYHIMAEEKKKLHSSVAKAMASAPRFCVRVDNDDVLSGPKWCEDFETSESIDDLEDPFKANFKAFHSALIAAGASVSIAATYRPKERAYLMHHCWMIKNKYLDPHAIARFPGVPIRWDHETDQESTDAAEKMCRTYHINTLKIPPALKSRHTEGYAVDMNISWVGNLTIETFDKKKKIISDSPFTGMNSSLKVVGAGYGVVKFLGGSDDPPHWSIDGS